MPLQDAWLKIRNGLAWRLNPIITKVEASLSRPPTDWSRVVMDRATAEWIHQLDPASIDALEISGEKWKGFGFRSYRGVFYPEHDICSAPVAESAYDLVIAEQVLEHVLWPYRFVKNVHTMLRPGGRFLATTPFLVGVHLVPTDCSRWTETGLKHLLLEAGFEEQSIRTGSWGNRACVRSLFLRAPQWVSWWHSLENEPRFPVVVWALATKPGSTSDRTM